MNENKAKKKKKSEKTWREREKWKKFKGIIQSRETHLTNFNES